MSRKPLYSSLVVSAGIHGVMIWFFYARPLHFEAPETSLYGKVTQEIVIPQDEDIDLSEKNIALEEVFNQIIVLSPSLQHPYDFIHTMAADTPGRPAAEVVSESSEFIQELPQSSQRAEDSLHLTAALSLPSALIDETLAPDRRVSPLLSAAFTADRNPSDYLRELQQFYSYDNSSGDDLPSVKVHYLPMTEETGAKPTDGQEMAASHAPPLVTSEFIALVSPEALKENTPDFNQQPIVSQFLSTPSLDQARELIKKGELPRLAAYGLPQGTTECEWSDEFDVEVKIAKQEEKGYLFSVSFVPKYDLSAKKMGQTTYFLIDRSNLVNKQKYASFKRGVERALEYLQEGDKFNIVVFDQKISKLSKEPLIVSKKSLQTAVEFLGKQEHGSYFAATDIYNSLPQIVPTASKDDEVTSVILLSDGDSSQTPQKQLKTIRPWLEQNSGKIHLYTATIGSGNNLVFLDLLSSFGRGSLLHSDTNSAFPRKLASLVLNNRAPIAKDIVAAAFTSDTHSHVALLTPSARLPCLFSKTPYTLYGTCDTPSEFMISLQGRSKNKTFSITKTISFAKAKQDNVALVQEFNKEKAHLYYDDFVRDGKVSALEKAKMILQNVSPRHRR